jgi:hypothetical protein
MVVFVVLLLAVVALIVGSVVSSNGPTSTADAAATCQKVAAALSDGPDASVDPVGFAEAQVIPLRQITTSDAPLRTAILQLSAAYESFFEDNDPKASSAAVRAASKTIDHYCPGVAKP